MLPRQLEGSPAAQAAILAAAKDVRRIGTETVDDTRTTHDSGTVTDKGLGAARDAATDKTARQRRIDNLDQFTALRIEGTRTMDLWVDEDHHTKRFRMRGDTYAAQGLAEGKPLELVDGDPLDMTVTFLDVNQPVAVEAPPAGDTAGIGALGDALRAGWAVAAFLTAAIPWRLSGMFAGMVRDL